MKKEGLCAIAHCSGLTDTTYACMFDAAGSRIHIELCEKHWDKLPEGWEAAMNYLIDKVPGSNISVKKTIEMNNKKEEKYEQTNSTNGEEKP